MTYVCATMKNRGDYCQSLPPLASEEEKDKWRRIYK